MHHVEAQVAHLYPSQQGVHIRAVGVHQPPRFVNQAADLNNLLVEKAQRAWKGYHHPCQVRRGLPLEGFQVAVAVVVRRNRHYSEARHGRRSRVCSVGAVGHQHLQPPPVAPLLMILLNHENAG